jgi:hypothetical protein
MPDIVCKSFTLMDNDIPSVESAMARLTEHPSDDPEGTLISTFEEVAALFRLAKQTGMVVRFRDDGFPALTVLWHWVGEGVGLSYILRDGRLRQLNLMLAGVNRENETNAICQIRSSIALGLGDGDWDAIHDAKGPTLVTFSVIPPQAEDGSYLLGMILCAAFLEISELS